MNEIHGTQGLFTTLSISSYRPLGSLIRQNGRAKTTASSWSFVAIQTWGYYREGRGYRDRHPRSSGSNSEDPRHPERKRKSALETMDSGSTRFLYKRSRAVE